MLVPLICLRNGWDVGSLSRAGCLFNAPAHFSGPEKISLRPVIIFIGRRSCLLYFGLLVFMFGASWGSFLNCAYYRLKSGLPLWGRSHCVVCGYVLKFWDLVPVLSYLFQKGRCRYCKCRIPLKYFLWEFLSGAVFLLLFLAIVFSKHL